MKFLVYSCFGIGDILMSTPVVGALYSEGHEVTLVCEEVGRELLDYSSYKGLKVLTYSRDKELKVDWRNVMNGIDQIYDALILTVPSWNNEGAPLAMYAKEVFAYKPLEEWKLREYNHTVELNLNLARKAAKDNLYYANSYWVGSEEYPCKDNSVVMHIGPQSDHWKYKAFPIDLYKMVAGFLNAQGYRVKIIGDENQKPYAEAMKDWAEDHTGTTIKELKNLIKMADAFIGNDCGPAHLASALYVPTITLFGPTYGGRTGPWPFSEDNRRIQAILPCGPCHLTERMDNCKEPICHKKITLDDVIREWREINV